MERIKSLSTALLVFPFILIGIWVLIIVVAIIGMPEPESA
jgi:hypothetical protein